jgi:hypothetical protein
MSFVKRIFEHIGPLGFLPEAVREQLLHAIITAEAGKPSVGAGYVHDPEAMSAIGVIKWTPENVVGFVTELWAKLGERKYCPFVIDPHVYLYDAPCQPNGQLSTAPQGANIISHCGKSELAAFLLALHLVLVVKPK